MAYCFEVFDVLLSVVGYELRVCRLLNCCSCGRFVWLCCSVLFVLCV